jgi:hypothetical protein
MFSISNMYFLILIQIDFRRERAMCSQPCAVLRFCAAPCGGGGGGGESSVEILAEARSDSAAVAAAASLAANAVDAAAGAAGRLDSAAGSVPVLLAVTCTAGRCGGAVAVAGMAFRCGARVAVVRTEGAGAGVAVLLDAPVRAADLTAAWAGWCAVFSPPDPAGPLGCARKCFWTGPAAGIIAFGSGTTLPTWLGPYGWRRRQ